MSSTLERKVIGEAGAWHSGLMQELRKKQDGGPYHRELVSISMRHIKRHCSNEVYRYYLKMHEG
ncbi:MAG: hypothetical protein JXR25_13610 [Pontiellaceae bacterium]|nr:hypothetical protein [Pontiellaceae bacterium]MBN2785853.1 hypothetical protein [Pontiellaceae bacterium]